MTTSLLEGLYGGFWGGAIGWVLGGGEIDAIDAWETLLTEAPTPEYDWAQEIVTVVNGDWTLAFDLGLQSESMNALENPAALGFWLGKQLGDRNGRLGIPRLVRWQYEALEPWAKQQAIRQVRSRWGVGAETVPILMMP